MCIYIYIYIYAPSAGTPGPSGPLGGGVYYVMHYCIIITITYHVIVLLMLLYYVMYYCILCSPNCISSSPSDQVPQCYQF